MAWLDWLLNLWVLVPLVALIPPLNEFGRLILEKRHLVPACAGAVLVGDCMAALVYAFLTRWRPTLVSLAFFLVFLAGMRWVGPRFARKGNDSSRGLLRNLVESGRRVNEDLRVAAINWGLLVVVIAIGVSAIHPAFGVFLVAVFAVWSLIWVPPFARTTQTGIAISIDCRPEDAFDFVSAVVNQPRYVPEIEQVEPLSPGPPRLGSTFQVRTVKGQEGLEEILDYDRPRRFASGLVGRAGSNRSIWTFEATAEGTRARYAWRMRLTLVEALIGMRVALRVALPKRNAQRRRWLELLKASLEGHDASQAA